MASLLKRGSVYYLSYYVGGKETEPRQPFPSATRSTSHLI